MNGKDFFAAQRRVETPSGRISYVERGSGPVALFVHGVLLNGYLWRHQLAELGDLRRCIAVDLLAHGHTEAAADQDVSVTANAHMLAQFLDALKIDRSLIREMQTDRSASDIVELIILLAHKMNLKVIAEGIETVRQLERLLELGCEYGQGYFFSQPMEAKAALIFMRQQLAARKSAWKS